MGVHANSRFEMFLGDAVITPVISVQMSKSQVIVAPGIEVFRGHMNQTLGFMQGNVQFHQTDDVPGDALPGFEHPIQRT